MTASADPDRLLDLHDHLLRTASAADDACDRALEVRRTAGIVGAVAQPGWRIDLHEGAEVRASAAVAQIEALARAVAQIAGAFALADRGQLITSTAPARPSVRTPSPAGLAEALQLIAPGLPPTVAGAVLRPASDAGRGAARGLRAALADLDPAVPGERAGPLHRAVATLHRTAGGDEVLLRTTTTAFLASLEAEELVLLVAALCDDERTRGPGPTLGLLAAALTAAASGPAPSRDLRRLIGDLASNVDGRNALRVLVSAGFAPPPPLAARLAHVLLVGSDATWDLGQGTAIASDTDPSSLWLAARHADGDEPAIDLLARDLHAAERFLGTDRTAVAERIERLAAIADRGGGQRSFAALIGLLATSASTIDADGTTSAHGRALVRGLVAGTAEPAAVGEPLAEALATAVAAHPDAYEALASGPPDDQEQLDRYLRAITQHRWPTVVLAAGLMDHRRRTMGATLHAPFERRLHALAPSRALQGAVERAGSATDRVEVDTTVFAVARSLVPLVARQAGAAIGGGPVVGGAVLLAQLAATGWIDQQRDRYRTAARPEPSVPLLAAARSQLRLDAWRVISDDPALADRMVRRGESGDPTAPDAPLQLDPDALAEWEQAQPAELRDVVDTFSRPFAPEAGTRTSPVGD